MRHGHFGPCLAREGDLGYKRGMKFPCFTLLLAILLLSAGPLRPDLPAREDAAEEPEAPELWFPVGEVLEYSVHWGVFFVARSVATTEWVEHEGRRLIRIRFETRSRGILNRLYPVDDYIESLIDPEGFLPVRFIKRLNEGSYSTDETTHFDWEAMEAHWSRMRRGELQEKTYALEPDTRDLVSFMYYMRSVPMEEGHSGAYRVIADEKIYDLQVDAPRTERIDLEKYGKVSSLFIHPRAQFEGLFVRKGEMQMWVSLDPRRVMTQLAVKVPVASVRIVLKEVRGPGNDAWILNPIHLTDSQKDPPS